MADKETGKSAAQDNSLSDSEIEKAKKEGKLQAIRNSAEQQHTLGTDTTGEGIDTRYLKADESQPYAHNLDLSVEDFQKLVAGKMDNASLNDTQVFGLLALERNGQNRTPYVKAMVDRLKLKPEEIPGGGPSYTNDVTNITELG